MGAASLRAIDLTPSRPGMGVAGAAMMLAGPDEQSWPAIGRLIDLLGGPHFERALFDFVTHYSAAQIVFGINLPDAGGGSVFMTEGDSDFRTGRARQISREYAEADYAGDEVFLTQNGSMPRGAVRLVVQRAEDREGEFRTKYFDDVAISQEVSIFDRAEGATLYLGYCANRPFSAAQMKNLQKMTPLVASLLRRHAALMSAQAARRATREARMQALRERLSRQGGLTPREVEICAAIATGYRAEVIADLLGISPNTVATHRKRAYAKLGISSQTELFGILVGALF